MDDSEARDAGSGIFITFEGGEGAGKTTHINFLAKTLRDAGYAVVCLREPGGTTIGEDLRNVVLDTRNTEMCDETELLIYEAARSQLVAETIAPALSVGKVVLCDRFYDSTIAYQVYGRGLPMKFVTSANGFACRGIQPDRTVLLTTEASAQEGLERATHHGSADRLERAGEEFHASVNEGFLHIAADHPDRIKVVSSAGEKPQTARAIFKAVGDLFDWEDVDERFDGSFFDTILRINTDKKARIPENG